MKINVQYYRQFDADPGLEVPGEGYGGWDQAEIEVSRERTALVVMHAWETGARTDYPGWYRAVEYIPRAQRILSEVFPNLLAAVRNDGFRVFHVVGGGDYYRHLPGFRQTLELAGPDPSPLMAVESDETLTRLHEFRRRNVFVGLHNEDDVRRGFAALDFPNEARPIGEEPIAESSHQLAALCRRYGVNHLIYTGFALNWCLLLSPGGMADMSRHGVLCSVIPEAVTAVENKETARRELCKEVALWRVALAFGFVFHLADFYRALKEHP